MNSYQKTCTARSRGALWFAAAILFIAPAGAQTQLTDAQAAALMQTLSAQAQNPAAPGLTQAQVQQLVQYMARQSQAAGSSAAANAAQLQMVQAMATQSASKQSPLAPAPGSAFAAKAPTATSATTLGPKKPGTIRVGIAQPKAQLGQGNSGNNVAEPIRAMIVNYLSGPMIEVTPLVSMLATQLDAEAKQKDCDYIVYSSMTMTQSSGGFGLLKKAAPMANMIPMVAVTRGIAGAAGAAAAGTAMSGAGGVANTVKAKSEVKFEYQLMAQGNATPLIANALTAKAHSDGEDVITPLIEKADEAILAAVTRK